MKRLLVSILALLAATVGAYAQPAPGSFPGCVYNATPPTLADKQTAALQCDSSGRIKTVSASAGTITFPATVAGTVNSGGIPYFNSTTQMSSSAALGADQVVLGGGAGAAPATSTALTFTSSAVLNLVTDSARLAMGTAADVNLYRDAANQLAQRNGVTAQLFKVYNTFTNSTNYERVGIQFSSNIARLAVENAGTGVARVLKLQAASIDFATDSATTRWSINSSGHIVAGLDNTYDVGATGATRPRNYFGGGNVSARTLISTGAVPTLALAGGTCAGTAIAGGSSAGTVTLTGVCAATNTMTLTVMATALTGYACDAVDRTLGTVVLGQTATTTTSATFTFLATTGATDVIAYKCIAY